MTSETEITCVMIVTAHPDDSEFGVAGTAAKFARQGIDVYHVICTNGNKGTADVDVNTQALAETRQREQRAACQVVGSREVVFLGYEDGELTPSLELRRDITRQIRKYKPDIVICHTPVMALGLPIAPNHPDHLAGGQAAFAAAYPSASSPHLFPELLVDEQLQPHKVKEIWFQATDQPNHWVDITDTVEVKIQALHQHRSQVGPGEWIDGMVREHSRRVGEPHGLPHAEAFRRFVL